MHRPKKWKIRKESKRENRERINKTKMRAMELSHIRRRIKLCMREIILSFETEEAFYI
jgi:hypothetical protein